MKKSWISVSLALFLAVLGAAGFTRCGSDGLVAAVTSAMDAEDVTYAAFVACDLLDCDGDFANDVFPEAKGAGDGDIYTITNILLELVGEGFWTEGPFDLDDVLEELGDAVPEIPEEGTIPLTVTGVTNIPCGDGDEETPGDGRITVTATFSGDFNGEFAGDENVTITIGFHNCLLEDDLFDNGETQSIRLNGSVRSTDIYREEPTETDPNRFDITGTITTSQADIDADNTGAGNDDEFWEGPINFNAHSEDFPVTLGEGPVNIDGGACFGANVDLGGDEPNDPETDEDDDCAADSEDDDGEYFMEAGELLDVNYYTDD